MECIKSKTASRIHTFLRELKNVVNVIKAALFLTHSSRCSFHCNLMKMNLIFVTLLVFATSGAWCCSLPKTCIEAGAHEAATPGTYTLYLGPNDTPVDIYCDKCKEYVTLLASNYGDNRCDKNWPQCGRTDWQKIRLDPRNLNVIGNDYTFATSDKVAVPYGQGGGCPGSSATSGGFRLDLTGTGFTFDTKNTKWEAAGYFPKSVASVAGDGLTAEGQCGGDCGYCQPIGNITLSI
ncbi:A disintegrin and metalloproteinase with thrombospondin motifs 9-like [Tubulanus polymorphus]|uniref:A disintegrin and metalloproteinase with thrombospondin motifs 9-like n=1 Tax=Tubulanus polymorphus TaxID=672921 RepID=UPI003DA28847